MRAECACPAEHMGKLLIIGTQLDITEKLEMVKKTQELMSQTRTCHAGEQYRSLGFRCTYLVSSNLTTILSMIMQATNFSPLQSIWKSYTPTTGLLSYDAMQSMLSGKEVTINFTCRMQTKYDNSWQYCNILGVPFEKDEYGNNIRFTGFRQNISKLHQLDEEVKERNYKMELTFKTSRNVLLGFRCHDQTVQSIQRSR